ncbi:MAG: SRPBCC domain-containing protein [Gammaproteobacteria bacterium]
MNQVTLVRRIGARPSIVFEALTTSEGISSWFGPDDGAVLSAALDVRVGGSYRIRFRRTDGTEHECTGQFLEIEAPRRIVMSWQWACGSPPEEEGDEHVSRLEYHLRPIDTGTELTLIHAGLRTEASARSHTSGWGGALDKLMRMFAH